MSIKDQVYANIEKLAQSEKITRALLADLSRDVLAYVMEDDDIDCVNRLIFVLTPVNREVAILFFGHFLPWEKEKDKQGNFSRFGKKVKGSRTLTKKSNLVTEFLSDPKNTIWTWANANVEHKKKPKDFVKRIQSAVKAGLKGEDETDSPALTPTQIVSALFTCGITIDDLMEGCALQEKIIRGAEDMMNGETPMKDVTPAAPQLEEAFDPGH